MHRARQLKRRQEGYLLLEVLITVGILSIGLLGLAAMQVTSLRSSVSATQRGEAAILIEAMADKMRANFDGNKAIDPDRIELYDKLTADDTAPPATDLITRAQLDFNAWDQEINALFDANSKPQGVISCTAQSSSCTIEINWLDPLGDDKLANPMRHRYIVAINF